MKEEKIVILGGEFRNKGAQAMTYVCISELKRRFPNASVYMVSNLDYSLSKEGNDLFNFKIIPKKEYYSLKNVQLIIEISGYSLGDYWGPKRAIEYMINIAWAKHHNIPFYILPQSFGPFSFDGLLWKISKIFMKHYLPYCKTIMARENEGKKTLENTFHLKNVVKTSDLVLQNSELIIKNIFLKEPTLRHFDIRDNSVAIIPNQKNIKFGKEELLYNLYKEAVEKLLVLNKNIYLISHSSEDLSICRGVKDYFLDDDKVILIQDELSCLEFDSIVNKFDYIIGSRYHSIIHSYRKNIPAIILGWAIKYNELAKNFNQTQFQFNITKDIDINSFLPLIDHMEKTFQNQSDIIKCKMEEIRRSNIFDMILI